MPWRIYQSTDASAPVLTGQVGSVVALLDACLVNGYGTKPAAGWTKPYTGTNKAAFRMGGGRLQAYLRVQDDAPVTAAEFRLQGFESMTGVDVGTDQLPAGAFVTGRKSGTTDATARPWVLVGDERTFLLLVRYHSDATASAYYFGEFFSFTPNDSFGILLTGRYWENTGSWTPNIENFGGLSSGTGYSAAPGHHVLRDSGGITKSIGCDKVAGFGAAALNNNFAGGFTYPNPADGSLLLAPIYLRTTEAGMTVLRGRMRGVWTSLHAYNATGWVQGDTVSGTGELSGKEFTFGGAVVSAANTTGAVFVESSDTVPKN